VTSRGPALQALLSPGSVAIVGASDDPGKPGYRPLAYLKQFGFKGAIYPVNPRLQRCQDVTCYPSLQALPEVPDLAVIIVNAARVPDLLEEAGRRGIRAAVIISAGFAEAGEEGRRLQGRVVDIAASHNMVVCGPNTVGVVRAQSRLAATFTEALSRGDVTEGSVALVSQSGAFGTVLYAQARERGVGVGTYVSSGNEACLTLGDYVEALVEDDEVRVIGCYIEGLRDARALERAALRGQELGKPIVALKVGRSRQGGLAAASHTGSMVGDDNAYRAAFEQLGIVQVDDERELLGVLDALQWRHNVAAGKRVAIVSTSGGAGVLLTDLLEERGLDLAEVSPALRARLDELLPQFAAKTNPIDVTGRFVTDPTGFDEVLRAVAEDPGVDVVIAFIGLAWSKPELWEAAALVGQDVGKPLVVVSPSTTQGLRSALRSQGVAVCDGVLDAVRLTDAMVRWGRTLARASVPKDAASGGRRQALPELPTGVLAEDEAKRLLAELGLPVPPAVIATSADEATDIARRIDGPVVLKVHAEGLAHKSEVGGVEVGVAQDDVADAFARIRDRFDQASVENEFGGVRVEPMVQGLAEIVIGAVASPPFGTLIAVGAGGTETELRRDLAYAIAPVGPERARDMIRSLAIAPTLFGYRGRPHADVDALVALVVRVSELVAGWGDRLVEMDLNPVLVGIEGDGVAIVDAMLVLR
jgi:acetate---CoA ligase (ADP-forming)